MRKVYIILGTILLVFFIYLAVNVPFNLQVRGTEDPVIAHVDLQEIFENHPDKIKAEEELNEMARQAEEELTKKLKDLEESKHQEEINKYQQEIEEKEEELIAEILKDIEQKVIGIAQKENVDLVLNGDKVYLGGYDLTTEVIEDRNE
ncbi:MAG: OmpH family outer membrane protein [Halanaerobiaceae bacterium]